MEKPRKSTVYVFGETSVSKAAPGTPVPPRFVYKGPWIQHTLFAGSRPVPVQLTMPDQMMPEVDELPPWRKKLPWLADEIYQHDDSVDVDYECELCEPTGRW